MECSFGSTPVSTPILIDKNINMHEGEKGNILFSIKYLHS